MNDEPGAGVSLTRLADVQPERVSWLWPGYIPAGKLVTLDGDPGLGKSTLAVEIGATITTGRSWPDGSACQHTGAVVVMSAEDGLADTVRPRFDAAGANVGQVYALEGVPTIHDDGTRTLRPPTLADAAALAEAIETTAARLLIVDVVMAYLPGSADAHRDQDVRRVLGVLTKIADATGCAVLLLRHLNKAAGRDPLYRGGGSIGIVGAARAGLLVARDPDDPETRVLASVKSNLGPAPASLAYQLADSPDHGCARVQWTGTSTHTAHSVLTDPDNGNEHDDRTEAERWLTDYLTENGTAASAEAKKAAAKAGISERTLKRAAKSIRVEFESRGFPRVTYWSLHSEVTAPLGTQNPGPTDPTGFDLHEQFGPAGRKTQLGQPLSVGPSERNTGAGHDQTGSPSPAAMPRTTITAAPADTTPRPPRQRQRTYRQQTAAAVPSCIVCGRPVTAGQGETHLSCKQGAAS